jgi:glycylpeptide N-tetradecanoyltransferase
MIAAILYHIYLKRGLLFKTMEVRKTPYDLPPGFEWSPCEVGEVQKLLAAYYVEDVGANFRLTYSEDFIKWALSGPDAEPDWFFCVRASETKKILACIAGTRMKVRVNNDEIQMAEINFLCVHPKLRQKKLAPLMIREVTRRINLTGIWQAVYTGAVLRSDPVTSARYWHRTLNVKKLKESGFAQINTTLETAERLYRTTRVFKARPMVKKDVPWVTKLLNEYFSKFKLAMIITEKQTAHMFLPRDDIVQSYVYGETDFFSFYSIPNAITESNDFIRTAYGYYFVPGQLTTTDLITEALGRASQQGYDCFNILDVAGNDTKTLWELKFKPGTGELHYYLFNWKLEKSLKQDEVGLILP